MPEIFHASKNRAGGTEFFSVLRLFFLIANSSAKNFCEKFRDGEIFLRFIGHKIISIYFHNSLTHPENMQDIPCFSH